MKRYEEAINLLPQKGDLIELLDHFLEPKTEHEIEQSPIQVLKAAYLCIQEWSSAEEFGAKVFETLKTVEYSKLDLFQKAVLHILASCQYKDGFFDIQSAEIDWNFNVEEWKKTI